MAIKLEGGGGGLKGLAISGGTFFLRLPLGKASIKNKWVMSTYDPPSPEDMILLDDNVAIKYIFFFVK